jgi:hypothetical protein
LNKLKKHRLMAALKQLLWATGGLGQERKYRLNPKRLIKELVSKRYRLSNAYRSRQSKKPITVIAVDVSGSCASVNAVTSEIAYTLSLMMPDNVVAVAHGNGWTTINGRDYPLDKALEVLRPAHYPELVVALGDSQGIKEYEALVKRGARFVWLTNEYASQGVKWRDKWMRAMTKKCKHKVLAIVSGASQEDSLVEAMELAAKKCRR